MSDGIGGCFAWMRLEYAMFLVAASSEVMYEAKMLSQSKMTYSLRVATGEV